MRIWGEIMVQMVQRCKWFCVMVHGKGTMVQCKGFVRTAVRDRKKCPKIKRFSLGADIYRPWTLEESGK